MKWRKLGHVYSPDPDSSGAWTHAANPVVEPTAGDSVRVYFSSRDKENRSSVFCLDLLVQSPPRVVAVGSEPCLGPGDPGLFDDSGASVGCFVSRPQGRFLFYTGWNLAVTVPWRNSIGLAFAAPGQTVFGKLSPAPILDRSAVDPYSVSYPWVLVEAGLWRMWYGSNLSWGREHRSMRHVLKYAESSDGICWNREGRTALPLSGENEWGVSKPCVVRDGSLYRMWFSSRLADTYRIGYAESGDGFAWERRDAEVGIDVSENGWDSEMIEYPCVFDLEGQRYMLYNGNGFGRSGFGLAVLETAT